MSQIEIPKEFYNSIKTVIKFQNILLLKEIAKEMGWKYIDLKKKYLKNADVKELIDYSNTQKTKIKKKKKEKEALKMVILADDEEEIQCQKYSYNGKDYFVNIENGNTYDMSKKFVGRKIGDVINFDEEEI